MEVVASLSQGRTAAAQCGLFTHKSIPVIFEPPCIPEISSSLLMTSLLIFSSLVYPLTLHRKRISAASRRAISRFVVTHLSLLYSNVGLATNL